MALAAELDAHAAGKVDPVGEMVLADRDHHRNIGIERALDQVEQALATALALAEAVDDDEIGAVRQRVRDPLARVLQPRKVEPMPEMTVRPN